MPGLITFGRIVFAVLFVYLGATKLFAIQPTADFVAAKVTIPSQLAPYVTQLENATGMTMPQLLAIGAGVFETLSGLMIALNFGVRFFAIILILYMAASTFYFQDFWNQSAPENARTVVDALKNVALIGARLMIAGYGRGPRAAEPAYGDV
jgi:putative oxidoreductase